MLSKFIISENYVVVVTDSTVSRPHWRLAAVESITISKGNEVRGDKIRLSNSNVLDKPINMLYPIEATKINNTNKLYSPLEKENEPVLLTFVLIKLF